METSEVSTAAGCLVTSKEIAEEIFLPANAVNDTHIICLDPADDLRGLRDGVVFTNQLLVELVDDNLGMTSQVPIALPPVTNSTSSYTEAVNPLDVTNSTLESFITIPDVIEP
jgi:hypothetical protein